MEQARCRGRTDVFFGSPTEGERERSNRLALAKGLCDACAVAVPCRELGRDLRAHGVWGGEDEMERRRAGYPVPGFPRSRRSSAA